MCGKSRLRQGKCGELLKTFISIFLCKAAVVDFFCMYRLHDRIFLNLSPVYSVKLGLNFMK